MSVVVHYTFSHELNSRAIYVVPVLIIKEQAGYVITR